MKNKIRDLQKQLKLLIKENNELAKRLEWAECRVSELELEIEELQ